MIACVYPVISILKLCPAGGDSPLATYQGIRGDAIVLPQNPSLLVNILQSLTFQVQDITRVVWARDKPYSVEHLQPFLAVRKGPLGITGHACERGVPGQGVMHGSAISGWVRERAETKRAGLESHPEE